MSERPKITPSEHGARVTVWAKPRAAKSRVLGVREGALEVAIAAPPVDGAANEELTATLAKHCGVPKRSVVLVAGQSGRHKVVEFLGMTADELAQALAR
ncbi:MAG: DUF167 domain-containing protein [Myxococcales bacterium]|nr:DUF167 domain-containing protein [Myxococcales bacterium]